MLYNRTKLCKTLLTLEKMKNPTKRDVFFFLLRKLKY